MKNSQVMTARPFYVFNISIVFLIIFIVISRTFPQSTLHTLQKAVQAIASQVQGLVLAESTEGSEGFLKPSKQDLKCMVLNLYHEARGEPLKGKELVVQTVINRTLHAKRFGRNFCESIEEYKQFSWTLDIAKAYELHSSVQSIPFKEYITLQEIVERVLNNQKKVLDSEKQILYYHNHTVKPKWSKKLKVHSRIGNHTFYMEG